MKKIKGFTLIELIVVIAIIGVLCAILVPTMMGWVTRSRISTANANAKELYNDLNAFIVECDEKGVTLDGTLEVYCRTVTEYPTISTSEIMSEDVCKSGLSDIDKNVMDTSGSTWAARFDDNIVTAVVYADKQARYVGGFPMRCPEEKEYKLAGTHDIADYLDCADKSISKDWK